MLQMKIIHKVMKNIIRSPKIVKKVSVSDTLLAIPVGYTAFFKFGIVNSGSIRATKTRLNKSGYHFEARETSEGYEVTRSK